MNYLCLFVFLGVMQVHAAVFAQQEKVTFKSDLMTVEQIFDVISSQLKYDVFYSEDELNVRQKVEVNRKTMFVEDVLNQVLGNKYSYSLEGRTIIIKPLKSSVTQTQMKTMEGIVKDKRGEVLPGVTVLVKGTTVGTSTDVDGKFKLEVPASTDVVLVFSFIGMKTLEVPYKDQKMLNITLEDAAAELGEVVVTGIFERKAESFTGATSTYKGDVLKMVGSQNILQSLKTLDPSFSIKENNEFGSDPNRLPNMEIRGKSSVVGMKEQFGNDPNQPLFILDGFETSLQTVVDLNMDRIASITILKDAASTAIYGSRAANGVVVIETKKPEKGRLKVRYAGDFQVTTPDLSVYNLMNATEKLEFERFAGMYTNSFLNTPEYQVELDQAYNERLANIKRGVNTYWLREPVRTGFVHRHNVVIEGGDENMLYSLGASYGKTNGVMKESGREVMSGNFTLIYRKGIINFNNRLTLDYYKANNPTVPFSDFAKANPYFPKYNKDGKLDKFLVNKNIGGRTNKLYNPLYNASLNNLDQEKNIGFRNTSQIEVTLNEAFKVSGRIGISKSDVNNEVFKSPFHSSFDDKEQLKRGTYSKTSKNDFNYDGDLIIRFGKLFGERHLVNAIAGWQFRADRLIRDGYVAMGFPNDEIKNPAFSNEYQEDSKPDYGENTTKSTSFYGNFGYSYDRRYQVDANIRIDGSSVFGTDKRFTETWSAGLSWNVHNEKFMGDATWMNMLRIRGSVGNPGNQNFAAYQSYTTYVFNTALQNDFGLGAVISAFGNPDLLWQKTLDINGGADMSFFGNRLALNFNVYRKKTDPLLISMTTPSSVGMTEFSTNFGEQITKGWDGTLNFSPYYHPEERKMLTITVTARHLKERYTGIGNKLGGMNEANQSTSLTRYYDGGSPSDVWAVRSGGIDPSTGKEIYIKQDGSYTFEHDYDDEVVVGNTEPKLEGTFGANFYWKGFSCGAFLRYRFHATVFNSAMYSKVENITKENWLENQDKRALYDRWQEPGDYAQFKGVGLVENNAPMTDRFIQNENSLIGESFNIGYEFSQQKWMKKVGLSNLSFRANMNDIFRASTVKAERGIDYPFARTVSLSVNASF